MLKNLSFGLGPLVIMLAALVAGCQKNQPVTEGPAEKAGQKIDQAASKAAVHLNSVAEKAGEGLSKAGEKLKQTAKDAQEKNAQQEPQK